MPKVQYTKEVPNSAKPGNTTVRRHILAKDDLDKELPSKAITLHENFISSTKKYGTCMFLGSRQPAGDKLGDYIWKVYYEIRDYSKKIGFGFHHLGLTHKDDEGHSFIGIYSKNREEWIITDLACMSQDITSVPLYDVQQAESINMIVEQTNMRAIVTTLKLSENVIKLKKQGLLQSIRYLIVFEEPTPEIKEASEAAEIQMYSLSQVSELVTEGGVENPPSPESWFTICYTSGTTGKSKGAVITHKSMIATLAGALETYLDFIFDDVYLSYLPLAHMLERIACHLLINAGARIGFFAGDVMKLKDDLAALRPTIFVSVPRLYSRFYDTIKQTFSSAKGVKASLIKKGLKAKEEGYKETGALTNGFWDKIVFNKVKNVLGGRVRLMVTGSAPIAADVLVFLRLVFSCPILEGYGQTETCAGSFLTHPLDIVAGHIGGPISTLEAKLMDVPDMEYFSTDKDENGNLAPRGEICMRGPTIFPGYYKAPELTAEALDDEGWLHSGDIGMILPESGAFKIIDRKKNFFKLSQGEYVSAEKIEMVYNKSYYISQIFVYGDSFQSYLVAIVVPDEAYIRKEWAHKHDFHHDTPFDDICNHPKLKETIMEDMVQRGKQEKLLGFEVVKKIHIENKAWTPEDLLTPTQKLMRFQAKKRYQDIITELYREPL